MVRRLAPRAVAWLGAALLVVFTVAPLWIMVVLSLDPDPQGLANAGLWPRAITFQNYRALTSTTFGFYPALQHSLMVSGSVTLASLVIATPGAYALARLVVPGTARILVLMLAFAFFPGIVLAAPLAKTFSDIGWLDHLFAIAVAQLSFTLPLAVWFLTYAFRAVPVEAEEAGKVDGAGVLQRMLLIVVPMARSGVAGTTALVFVASWNDFLFASVLNRSRSSQTLPVMLASLPEIGFLGGQMAAAILTCLPVVLVVAALLTWLSRRVVDGGGR